MPSVFNRAAGNHGPGSIGCTRTLLKLQSYLDGDLDEATARKILRHIDACERCGLRAEAYTAVKAALARRREAEAGEVGPMVGRLQAFASDLVSNPPR